MMIELEVARKFVDALPWPEGASKPFVRIWRQPDGDWCCLLHEKVKEGWRDVATVGGPTPEGALRYALEMWLSEKGMNDQPAMYYEIRKLVN